MPRSSQSRKEGYLMVTLSTASQNITFENVAMAEIYAIEKITQNCCILSNSGKVLSFKRKEDEAFTRIAKQTHICDTPLSQPTC
jgi:hypothetical protein